MDKGWLFFILAVLLCMLPVVALVAQEEMPKGQLISIHEDRIMPSKVGKYEEAAKNLAAILAKHGITTMSYTGAMMNDFTYIYFTPVANLAAVEQLGAGFQELQQKMGKEAFEAAMAKFSDCYQSHRNYMARMRTDLSYKPEYGSQISEGMNFRHWDFYHIHPGMEQEAEAIAKEWKALYEKKGIAAGYRIYSDGLGLEGPVYVVVQPAKSAAEFYNQSAAHVKALGEEGKALQQKTWSVIWKFEQKDGFIRPDLSHLPSADTKSD